LALVCSLADVIHPIPGLDHGAGITAKAVDLFIVIPAAVAGIGLTPKEPNGRARRAAGDRTLGATSVVGPHCVPRETGEVGSVGT
jgi:hypothetical protein